MIGYESRRVIRSPVVLAVLALLLLAGTWGALNTARLHAHQAADVARMAQDEARWYEDIEARAARYSVARSSLGEGGQPPATYLPYWQDPTGASGFSRYFLRRFAAKPHLPLSVLAVGQSDLQPFAIPLRLETLFGGDRVYDFEPPRALATGRFDSSFVLVFVLPICLGVAAGVVGAQECDQGILPVVGSQPVSPTRWWSRRLGALAIVFVPGVAASLLVALVIAGAPVVDAWPETLSATMLVSAQTLFWLAVVGWCLARGQGAVSTASTVAGIWLLLTVAAPLAGSVIVGFASPTPSPVIEASEQRRTRDAVQAEADRIVVRRLADHFGPEAASIDPAALDYSTRLVLLTQQIEDRLAHQEARRHAHVRATSQIGRVVAWLSPQIAFQTALADLAGTSTERHQSFLQDVRQFQLGLRAFMYPRVLEQARSTTPRACAACPGRLTFTDYDAIPRFRMKDAPAASRVTGALRTAGWLALVASVVAGVGVGRRAAWGLGS